MTQAHPRQSQIGTRKEPGGKGRNPERFALVGDRSWDEMGEGSGVATKERELTDQSRMVSEWIREPRIPLNTGRTCGRCVGGVMNM